MPPEDYRDRLLRPPVYRPADQDVTVRISPADLDRLLAQAARLPDPSPPHATGDVRGNRAR